MVKTLKQNGFYKRSNCIKHHLGYCFSVSSDEIVPGVSAFIFKVKDLLNPSSRESLSVRWSKDRGFYVENLFIVECETQDDLLAVLEEG